MNISLSLSRKFLAAHRKKMAVDVHQRYSEMECKNTMWGCWPTWMIPKILSIVWKATVILAIYGRHPFGTKLPAVPHFGVGLAFEIWKTRKRSGDIRLLSGGQILIMYE